MRLPPGLHLLEVDPSEVPVPGLDSDSDLEDAEEARVAACASNEDEATPEDVQKLGEVRGGGSLQLVRGFR